MAASGAMPAIPAMRSPQRNGDDARAPAPHLEASGLDRLASEEAARLRDRLRKTARPCGCKSGAAAALGTLIIWPAWIFASGAPRTLAGWGVAIVVYPLIVAGAGIVGKVTGIVAGRWRHQRLRRQVAERLAVIQAGG